MYLASAGLALVIAWAWGKLAQRHRRTGYVVGGALCLVFAASTLERNRVWASPVSLWEDAVDKGPQMFRSRANLALAYNKQGRADEALEHLDIALKVNPEYPDAWIEMGNILQDRGETSAAEQAYRQALRFNPGLNGAYYNLGNIYLKSGRAAAAVEFYDQALARDPHLAIAYNNRGQAYENLGRLAGAVAEYRKALQANPQLAQAWFNLAAALEHRGVVDEAEAAYDKAHELLVAHPEYHTNSQYREFARRAVESVRRLQGE